MNENGNPLIMIIDRLLNSATKNGDNEDRETVSLSLRRSNRKIEARGGCLLPLTVVGPYLNYAVSVNLSFLTCEIKMLISAQPNILRSCKIMLHELMV